MKTFETIDQAIEVANQLSKEQHKNISIYKAKKENNFVIFDNETEYQTNYFKYTFAYLCCGFITPFAIGYKLFKDKTPVVDQFETRLQMESALKEKRYLGYNPIKLNNDSEIYQFLNYYQK